MKRLALFLLLLVPAFIHAQTAGGLTIDDLKARAKQSKVSGDVHIFYDKFRDKGSVMSKPENIIGGGEAFASVLSSGGYGRSGTLRVIMVAIESRFDGQKLTETPDKFTLVFDSRNASHMFLKGSRKLYVLYDGQRLELDALGHDSDVNSGTVFSREVRVEEKLAYELTRAQVEAIASAKKVEILIGGNETPRELKSKVFKGWKAVLELTKIG